MKTFLILSLVPWLAAASTFTDKYHGEFRGEFKDTFFGPKKECSLKVQYSHSGALGNIEIRYHSFDFDFNQAVVHIDGYDLDMKEIDGMLSENWFMMDWPHKSFVFSRHFVRKLYLGTKLYFNKEKDLTRVKLFIADKQLRVGDIFGPNPFQGIDCKNLKRVQ